MPPGTAGCHGTRTETPEKGSAVRLAPAGPESPGESEPGVRKAVQGPSAPALRGAERPLKQGSPTRGAADGHPVAC